MRTITKTIYEAPAIHLKQVMMESDIMAASGDKMQDAEITISTTGQKDGGDFNFSDNSWE